MAKMRPADQLRLKTHLSLQSGGDLELFFSSYGLESAYNAPSQGWGKAKRIASAMAVAEQRGDADEILVAAARHFGLADIVATPPNDHLLPPRPAEVVVAVPSEELRHDLVDTAEDELRRRAYAVWDATGEWPIARVLQRRVESDGGRLDVEATARGLDRGVGYLEQNLDARVVLRLGGLVHTESAERYVSAFIAVVQLAYRQYRDADSEEGPTLSDELLRTELSMDGDLTRRMYSLLEGEWFLLEGGTSSANGWHRDVSPNIRYFRDVKTGDDYVRAANDLVRPYLSEPGARPNPREAVSATEPSAPAEQGIQIFHTVIYGGAAAIGTHPSVNVNVTPGDLTSLMRFLAEHGVEWPDQQALAEAMGSDAEDSDGEKPGRRVTAWLGRVALKLAASGARVGEGTAASLIATAVARYLRLV